MADEPVFEIVRNKRLPALVLVAEDENGAVVPLNDYGSPTAQMCTLTGSDIPLTGVVSIDGPNGEVQFDWSAADVDVAGQFLMRLTIIHIASGDPLGVPSGGGPIRISIAEEC